MQRAILIITCDGVVIKRQGGLFRMLMLSAHVPGAAGADECDFVSRGDQLHNRGIAAADERLDVAVDDDVGGQRRAQVGVQLVPGLGIQELGPPSEDWNRLRAVGPRRRTGSPNT